MPAKSVQKQATRALVAKAEGKHDKYPRNNYDYEGNFADAEKRKTGMLEVPVTSNTPFDVTKPPTSVRDDIAGNRTLHPNDRAHAEQNPVNDPDVCRAVVHNVVRDTTMPNPVTETSEPHVLGLVYHPEGDRRGFRRAPLEPMDRRGRQIVRRHDDDHDRPQRGSSWPPRGLDAGELACIEARYQKREPSRRRRHDGV